MTAAAFLAGVITGAAGTLAFLYLAVVRAFGG